ncbi:MAG: hypothetical protein ACI837_001146 [Crocinitomicaceae bacterium]|jgi:hypothetical protein
MNRKTIKTTGYAAAVTILAVNLQSCSKYDDGPGFSLRSKKARIVGEWDIVQIGSQVFPQNGYSLEMEFEKDGDFKFTYSYASYSYSYAGDWEFSSDKEELDLIVDGEIVSYEIKRLTNKEVWIEDEFNDEWKLEAQ